MKFLKRFLFLGVISAGLLFWNLHKVPLFEPDEGRYSDMALHMVQSGDWITPHMNGLVHLHKPPLSSWLVAASFKIFGPSEASARLPGVLLSLLIIVGIVRVGRFLFNDEAGFCSAWVLLTSILYFVTSRLVTTDMTLTFLLFCAMALTAELFFGGTRRLLSFYLLMISLGLAMLTKGPVALMIALTPAAVFALWEKRGFKIPLFHWALGLGMMLALSLSWYLVICFKHPGALNYFIGDQLAGRMMKSGAGHRYPVYYYLIVLPLGFLPWTLSLWDSLVSVVRKPFMDAEEKNKVQFLTLWLLIPLLLFSLIKTKLATYIVPLFPAMALLLGRFWAEFNAGRVMISKSIHILFWFLAALPASLFFAGLIFIIGFPEFVRGISPAAFVVVGILLLGMSAVIAFALKKRAYHFLFSLQVSLILLLALIGLTALPKIEFENSKVFSEKIRALRKPGDSVVMYDDSFSSLPFYLRERVISVGRDPEVRFDSLEDIRRYVFFNDIEIIPFFRSNTRTFILTTRLGLKKIRFYLGNPLYNFWETPVPVLLERGDLVLLSNRA